MSGVWNHQVGVWSYESGTIRLEMELLPRVEMDGAKFLDVLLDHCNHVGMWSHIMWWMCILDLRIGEEIKVLTTNMKPKFRRT